MTIGDKIFSYIDTSQDLTLEMVNNYRNSLIFIGDEQQIFQPLTGSYVGLGKTAYNNLLAQITNNNNNTTGLYEHVHQNVVNSIWVEYNCKDPLYNLVDSVFGSGNANMTLDIAGHTLRSGDSNILMTNQDVVIKGLHDYNKSTGLAKSTDDIGHALKDSTGDNNVNNRLWQHIDLGTYGSSGIVVNVHHFNNGNASTYMTGKDEYGFTYSYWKGQDYITIDDHLTWSYIAAQTSYLMSFSKKMAVQQANRIYHDILGGNDPVFIEKEFNEVFTTDYAGDLVPIVEGELGEVYVHLKDPINDQDNNTGVFNRVRIYNSDTDNKYYIYVQVPGTQDTYYILQTNDTSIADNATISIPGLTPAVTITKKDDVTIKGILFPDDGYDTLTDVTPGEKDKDWNIVWYHIDAEATAQGKMNLADGIQTFKEVTAILDRLTDGSDDNIINLTYNIAQNAIDIADLKAFQQAISNNVITSIDGKGSQFVLLNSFSKDKWEDPITHEVHGDAEIDINLCLAQTYVANNGTTYAAYTFTENGHNTQVAPIWINKGDTTYTKYWYKWGDVQDKNTLWANLQQVYGNDGTINIYSDKGITYQYKTIQLNTTTRPNTGDYILFTYEKLDNSTLRNGNILDGITTVNWVTTYYKWAREDMVSYVISLDNDVKDWVQTYINGMNTPDTAVEGQYVTRVQQVNGKIEVTRQKLPLDQIIYSPEIYGNDFFVEISKDYAKKIFDSLSNIDVYIKNGSNYQKVSNIQSSNDVKYYLRERITNFTPINTDNINASNGLQTITNDLLANAGKVTYFYSNSNVEIIDVGKIRQYKPVDIQELLSDSNYSVDGHLKQAVLEKLFYYDDVNTSSKLNKYFDVSYRQRVDGATEMFISSYVTYLGASSSTNNGLADSWDVRHTIERMFSWVNLKTNQYMDN